MPHDRVQGGVMGKDCPGTWQSRALGQAPHTHWRPGRGLAYIPRTQERKVRTGPQPEHKGRKISPEFPLGFKLFHFRILTVLAVYLLPNSSLTWKIRTHWHCRLALPSKAKCMVRKQRKILNSTDIYLASTDVGLVTNTQDVCPKEIIF